MYFHNVRVCCLFPPEVSFVKTGPGSVLSSCSTMSQRIMFCPPLFSLRLARLLVSRGPQPFQVSHADGYVLRKKWGVPLICPFYSEESFPRRIQQIPLTFPFLGLWDACSCPGPCMSFEDSTHCPYQVVRVRDSSTYIRIRQEMPLPEHKQSEENYDRCSKG